MAASNNENKPTTWDGDFFDEALELSKPKEENKKDAEANAKIQRFRAKYADSIEGYLPMGSIKSRSHGHNDIVIGFTCCSMPVPVGTLTENDRRLGFKYLPGVGGISCPARCAMSRTSSLTRKPSRVIHPSSATMTWVASCGKNGKFKYPVKNVFLYFDSYFLDADDIKPKQGTYHITARDREYLSVLELAAGWRTCTTSVSCTELDRKYLTPLELSAGWRLSATPVTPVDDIEQVHKARICLRNPEVDVSSIQITHMEGTPFVLSEDDLKDGWAVVYYDNTALSKRAMIQYS